MALIKNTLKQNISSGLQKIFLDRAKQALDGDENEKPEDVIARLSSDMADVITNAIDTYIKSGDIVVGPTNITVVTATGSPCVVTPATPAKIK